MSKLKDMWIVMACTILNGGSAFWIDVRVLNALGLIIKS
jgi:hypothetical protein